MAFRIPGIAKLLGQLTILIPAANSLVKNLGVTISTFRENPTPENRLNELENAIKLQAKLSKSLTEQLDIVQSVLANLQKSLKVLTYTVLAIAILALLAFSFTLAK